MKKLKKLLFVLLIMFTLIPFGVMAEEEKKEEVQKEPVKLYIFHGSTCQYCLATFEWFDTIEEEYGDYFDVVDYEVWGSQENASLMEEVSDVMGDSASGVPYIIVGNYSYPNGFAADTVVDEESGKTMGNELIEHILEVYESDDRYDVMAEIANKPDYSNVVGIVALTVIVGFGVMVVVARRQSK